MNDRFLDINVEAATFRGLSLPFERKVALIGGLVAWLSITLAVWIA